MQKLHHYYFTNTWAEKAYENPSYNTLKSQYDSKTPKMLNKCYKTCAVPLCKSTTIKTPDKLFITVPQKEIIRKKWCKLARRDPKKSSEFSAIYFCEDHFDLPSVMENYMEYHIKGFVLKIRLKPDSVPTRFDCQPDRRRTSSDSDSDRSYMIKRQRRIIVEELLESAKSTQCPVKKNIEQITPEKSSDFDVEAFLCKQELLDSKPVYKYCIVPQCKNNTVNAPRKHYFSVPENPSVKRKWCNIMNPEQKYPLLIINKRQYCCEDHFNLVEDTENFMKCKIMHNVEGRRMFLRLKKGVLPRYFDTQHRCEPNEEIDVIQEKKSVTLREALANSTQDVAKEEQPILKTANKSVQVQRTHKFRSKATQVNQKLVDRAVSPIKMSKSLSKYPFKVGKQTSYTCE